MDSVGIEERRRIWALCASCAESVSGVRAPSEAYAAATTNLLLGTIAHESGGFRYRRQLGFAFLSLRGAYGLCQCERGSVEDSLKLLKSNKALGDRAAQWLWQTPTATAEAFEMFDAGGWLVNLAMCDRAAVLFCRLHYMRVSAPIPSSVEDQDAYYKRYYNTTAGAAKPGDFTRALRAAMGSL